MDLFEFGKYHLLADERAESLRKFLSDVWSDRFEWQNNNYNEKTEEESSEENTKKQRILRFDGNRIAALNYVGFIQWEDQQLNIWPKIFDESHDHRLMTSHILYWLSYCQRVHFPKMKISLETLKFDNLLEAFIYIFAHYTKSILESQPYNCYEEITEDTMVMRGRLDMNGYITRHLTTGNWQNLHCTYEPFVYDNLFNRIVKYVSSLLLLMSKNDGTKMILSEITFLLDDVVDQQCTLQDCQKVKFNRLFEDLDIILEMCKMFLGNTTITSTKDSKQNFCFLLPMEYIFEDFLFGFIQQHFPETCPKRHKSDLFLTDQNVFMMEHDIFLENQKVIIDAKYKVRDFKESDKKCGISQSDMYQQVCYAIRRESHEVILLYPSSNDDSRYVEFEVTNPYDFRKIRITGADINIFCENIKEFDQKIIEQLRPLILKYQLSI